MKKYDFYAVTCCKLASGNPRNPFAIIKVVSGRSDVNQKVEFYTVDKTILPLQTTNTANYCGGCGQKLTEQTSCEPLVAL